MMLSILDWVTGEMAAILMERTWWQVMGSVDEKKTLTLFLDMLHLRSLWDIQVRIPDRYVWVYVWN